MWFDSNLRRESRRRDRLRKAFLRTKTVSAEKQYKQQRNRVNNLKKQAKELFYANINENLDELKTTDSKMYWKTIHMLIKNERSANTMPPLRDRDNNFNLSYDCFEKAGILNRHFCSVSDLNDRNKDLPPFEVLDMISTLDAKKAVGPDIISNKMFIAVTVQISKPLCILFNKSLHHNIFLTDWKLAHAIPLFTAGDKAFPSNYRPVSLLSCVSKLLEKIVFKHIFNHSKGN